MKSAQETILEIARKPEVIRNVMEQMEESSSSFFGSAGISDNDIEEMQGDIEFGAPNGAEFGLLRAKKPKSSPIYCLMRLTPS